MATKKGWSKPKKMILIKPGDTLDTVTTIEVQAKPKLKDLQKHVEGYIEVLTLNWGGEGRTALVNEEGLPKGLPVNVLASECYNQFHNVPLTRKSIVGNCLVLIGFKP